MSKAPTPIRGPLHQHYAGRFSRKFWDSVNSLKGKEFDAAYAMGCMLQDHESRVLAFVNEKLRKRKCLDS